MKRDWSMPAAAPAELPPVVILANGATLPDEAEAIAQSVRAKVIRTCDPTLLLRHMRAAFARCGASCCAAPGAEELRAERRVYARR